MIDKQALRQHLKQQRRSLSATDIATASLCACDLLRRDARFQAANTIAIYSPFAGEIDPRGLISSQQSFYLPVVENGKGMRFVETNRAEAMHPNRFGILEPQGDESLEAASLDMVVLPLVAFNRRGVRLGMGAGFYDRALANAGSTPCRVGFAYDWQEVDELMNDPWDVPLHAVVTDKEIIHCS